jgi:predicted MFS family arabinose efflux permease
MFNTARFLGPIFAGIILVNFGAFACFGMNALSYIAVIASLLLMRLEREEPLSRHESVWGGFHFIWQNKSVFRTVALIGAASLTIWSISTLFPVLASHFGHAAAGYSAIMTVNGVGAAAGGLLIASIGHRLPRRVLVYAGPIVCGAAFLALTWMPNFVLALACLFVAGLAMIVLGVSAQTKVQEDVTDTLRGRVMAVYSLVFSALMPLGGLLIGFLAERIGTMQAIRLSVAVCVAATSLLFAWSQREFAARESAPGPAARGSTA